MVLIDSPTDLMATAGRQIPKVITRLENFNDPSTFRTDVNSKMLYLPYKLKMESNKTESKLSLMLR